MRVKDRYSVSGTAYQEMSKVCRTMPRHYKIKQKFSELNLMWDIKPAPPSIIGVQQSLEPCLRRIEQLEKTTPEDAPLKMNNTVQVKLSGDSTNMGKHIQIENFTYTLLDEGDKGLQLWGLSSSGDIQSTRKIWVTEACSGRCNQGSDRT